MGEIDEVVYTKEATKEAVEKLGAGERGAKAGEQLRKEFEEKIQAVEKEQHEKVLKSYGKDEVYNTILKTLEMLIRYVKLVDLPEMSTAFDDEFKLRHQEIKDMLKAHAEEVANWKACKITYAETRKKGEG